MTGILFAASEAQPLIKTGGLADVAGSLPPALHGQGEDIRLILPAYADVLAHTADVEPRGEIRLGDERIRLLETRLPGGDVPVILVEHPWFSQRAGNPYMAPDGEPWKDNAQRFHLFSRTVAEVGMGRAGLEWRAAIVHCNDWQSGLAPALLSLEPDRPATVFTIHNLAYQGLFEHATFQALDLPGEFWSMHALEFHGMVSFIKGGLAFADRLTTVSPSYAREIQTSEFGWGLDGLLRHRSKDLRGILNGIDTHHWDPARDPLIPAHFDARNIAPKALNKQALQKAMGLPVDPDIPVVGFIGRLVEQKGVDLMLETLERWQDPGFQLIILGSGERNLEDALRDWGRSHPHRVGVHIGFEEGLSHQIEAGADIFLMPSRFEPCGLNQMYSLRYGTVPIVHAVGGLNDTVIDASDEHLADGTANGFVFREADVASLHHALDRALALYRRPEDWRRLQRHGMQTDFSWDQSAAAYRALYRELLASA